MKLLLENWREYLLAEGTDLLKSKNGNIVIFSDRAKKHIERGHRSPGKGSIFADFNLSLVNNALNNISISDKKAVYTVKVPQVGYDLVLPIQEALALPDATRIEVEKEDKQTVKVPGIVTSAPLRQFATNQLSIVIRPTTELEHVPVDLRRKIAPLVEQGKVFSILSAWPGRGDVPPAPQWKNRWAVVIPRNAQ